MSEHRYTADTARYDFWRREYELKAGYLSDHFGRMWIRFNFFISIQTALAGFLVASEQKNEILFYFAGIGVLTSLVWWLFGAQDKSLVEAYRHAVCRAARRMKYADAPPAFRPYHHYVGNPDYGPKPSCWNPLRWRAKAISVTSLPALVSLSTAFLWSALAFFAPKPELRGTFVFVPLDLVPGLFALGSLVLIAWGLISQKENSSKMASNSDSSGEASGDPNS